MNYYRCVGVRFAVVLHRAAMHLGQWLAAANDVEVTDTPKVPKAQILKI